MLWDPLRIHLTFSRTTFFSLGITHDEALRAYIGSKSAISLQRRPVYLKFQVEGVAPINHSFSQKTRLYALSFGEVFGKESWVVGSNKTSVVLVLSYLAVTAVAVPVSVKTICNNLCFWCAYVKFCIRGAILEKFY